jgi:outer membrane biosynthesis protein TonB
MHTSGEILERRIDMILTHQPSKVNRRRLPALARAALIFGFAALLLPQAGVTAELPLTPSEIRLAGIQPLLEEMSEGMSLMAGVIAGEPEPRPTPAEPAVQLPAPAQDATGTVDGTVSDQSGAVVPGVTVTLTGPAGPRRVITNEIGRYAFPAVPVGQYTLQARLPGFTAGDRTVSVGARSVSAQDIALQLARVVTRVEVSTRRETPAQTAPQNVAPTRPVRVGGDIAQPNLISQVKPVYPATARAAGLQDYVQLVGVIGTDGIVHSLQVDPSRPGSANADLIKAAIDSVQQWRYRPGMLNGSPVEVSTTITVNFSLVD